MTRIIKKHDIETCKCTSCTDIRSSHTWSYILRRRESIRQKVIAEQGPTKHQDISETFHYPTDSQIRRAVKRTSSSQKDIANRSNQDVSSDMLKGRIGRDGRVGQKEIPRTERQKFIDELIRRVVDEPMREKRYKRKPKDQR